MSNDIPERWVRRIKQRGYVRERGGGPNLTALARDAGLHTSTVSNALRGTGHAPEAKTVAALVALLGDDTAGWFDRDEVAAWTPPTEAALLTPRQRRAVDELIRAMVERREDTHDGTATSDAGERRHTVTVLGDRGSGLGLQQRAARRGRRDLDRFEEQMDAAGEEPQLSEGED